MKRTALSDEDRVSVAEEVMERSGYAGRVFQVPVARRRDAEPLGMDPIDLQREWSAEAESYVAQVLGRPGIAVEPMHWDLRSGGGQALTDGMNYIGLAGESVNELTLLHEVAHIITRTREGRGGHGPEFQETAYQLYAQHLGPGAAQTFASLVWPEGRSAMKIANSDVIVRGFCFSGVSFDLAQKYMNGSVSASDIVSDIERQWGSVGIWWGTVGSSADDFYSSVEDAREYAAGAGDEYVEDQWEWMEEYQGGPSADAWVGAEVEVVLVGKRPQRDYGAWNPTLDNGEGSIWESTSFLSEGDRIELVQVQYSFDGTNWKTESTGGLTVTAHRTAASELRVHLFDSEGHEMSLEPDFDSNPWTYHPKVMDAVRFLADVAQEDGVYWHMDHNEWIPSTITDFKVFDGANDVTHEIKEFPQLRGYYASRTAAVDYILQKLLDECETSESSYHDYAILQAFIKFPEEVLDTHPFAWELKKCQKEARESEYPETDNVLVEWLIEINEKGKDHQSRTAYVSDDIYESYYDTDRLVYLVMNVYVWGTDQPLWELVANSPEEAQAFFDSLDEDERRVNVSEVLENGGWDLRGIGRKFSNRTAAEEGGVLPWTPSHNGYYWIVKNDDSLEAVTNDGVNRMRLYEKPWGWEWVVKDDIGVVEKGNFGSAMSPDAVRDRANDLLAEFDTNSQRRTRGPGRGYQEDYTQAPNELWGRRATTSQRYAERLRREGRR